MFQVLISLWSFLEHSKTLKIQVLDFVFLFFCFQLILYFLSIKYLLLLSFIFSLLPKLSYFSFHNLELFYPQFPICCFRLNYSSTLKTHWLIEKTITSQVLWQFQAKTTWWNTRWLNERYLPLICMWENKILTILTKRFNEPWKRVV